jgi:hypothetical protein
MNDDNAAYDTVLKATYGILFFGCPNRGMNIESLISMCEGQPNLSFLHTLRPDSPILRQLNRDWPTAFPYVDSKIIAFYETHLSPTAVKVNIIFQGLTEFWSRRRWEQKRKRAS